MIAICVYVAKGYKKSNFKIGDTLVVKKRRDYYTNDDGFITQDGHSYPLKGGVWHWRLMGFKDYCDALR